MINSTNYVMSILRDYYPNALYKQMKGSKGCVAGQGELKNAVKTVILHQPYACDVC